MAGKVSGKGTYVSFGGTALWVAGRDFDVTHKQNTADSTAGADEYENTVNTTKNISASMNAVMILDTDGGTTLRAALKPGTEAELLWGWEGNGAGKPKGGFLARVGEASITTKHNDVTMVKVTWEMAGDALLFDDTEDTW